MRLLLFNSIRVVELKYSNHSTDVHVCSQGRENNTCKPYKGGSIINGCSQR